MTQTATLEYFRGLRRFTCGREFISARLGRETHVGMSGRIRALLVGVAMLSQASVSYAQLRPQAADIEVLVDAESVPAGSELKVGVAVSLAEGFHVQSDAPRDPALIPTVMTVDPPASVTVQEIVFPAASELMQRGSDQTLAVFEQRFTIGVRLAFSASLEPGDLVIPGRLRYQTCDEAMCYAPTSASFNWTVHVVPKGSAVSRRVAGELAGVHFGSGRGFGEEKSHEIDAPQRGRAASDDPLAQLARFEVASTTGGYLDSAAFLSFVRNAEQGVREVGWFEGCGPLAILLIVFLGGLALNLTPCVLPMIPINLAIIGAGLVIAFVWQSAWPDLIVGLAIAVINADAAREVWQAAREEHRLAA